MAFRGKSNLTDSHSLLRNSEGGRRLGADEFKGGGYLRTIDSQMHPPMMVCKIYPPISFVQLPGHPECPVLWISKAIASNSWKDIREPDNPQWISIDPSCVRAAARPQNVKVGSAKLTRMS